MALFKISKGLAENLPQTYNEGYCYLTTDDKKFYIDTTNTAAGRICINDIDTSIPSVSLTSSDLDRSGDFGVVITSEDCLSLLADSNHSIIKVSCNDSSWSFDTYLYRTEIDEYNCITFKSFNNSNEKQVVIYYWPDDEFANLDMLYTHAYYAEIANFTNSRLTFNNSGSGAASGTTFNGYSARTISYNTIGAAAASALDGKINTPPTITIASDAISSDDAAYDVIVFTQAQIAILEDSNNPIIHFNIPNAVQFQGQGDFVRGNMDCNMDNDGNEFTQFVLEDFFGNRIGICYDKDNECGYLERFDMPDTSIPVIELGADYWYDDYDTLAIENDAVSILNDSNVSCVHLIFEVEVEYGDMAGSGDSFDGFFHHVDDYEGTSRWTCFEPDGRLITIYYQGENIIYVEFSYVQLNDSSSHAYTPYVMNASGLVQNKLYVIGAQALGETRVFYQGGTGIYMQDNVLYGAAWNDYAEYRQASIVEPGRVVQEDRSGIMKLATERLSPACEIISDTFGFAIGQTELCQAPIAATGRVLAYPDAAVETFELGDAVCSGVNGTVSKMTRDEIREYPERILGTVSEIPNYEYWGENNIKVNGRIWIRIR